MGGLLEAIKAEADAGQPLRCPIARLARELPDADSADLAAAVGDRSIEAAVIGRALRGRGHPVSDDAIRRHRRGVCACGKTR